MQDNRWLDLWSLIVDLKVKVRTLLDARDNVEEWQLRSNRREVDRLIKDFFFKHYEQIASVDPDLFNDFLAVYAIREFATENSRLAARREVMGEANPPEGVTFDEAVRRLAGVRDRLDGHLERLVPYWQRYEETGKASDVTPATALLAQVMTDVVECQKVVQDLSWLKSIGEDYDTLRQTWSVLKNEVSWLSHVAQEGQNVS